MLIEKVSIFLWYLRLKHVNFRIVLDVSNIVERFLLLKAQNRPYFVLHGEKKKKRLTYQKYQKDKPHNEIRLFTWISIDQCQFTLYSIQNISLPL